jgi:hypothetical protein
LPISDVHEAYKIYNPQYILTICTTTPNQSEIQGYLDTMGRLFNESQILLTGYQVVGQDLNLSDNMEIIPDISRLVRLVEEVSFS